MKKLFITLMLGMGLMACNAPIGEFGEIADIPGVKPGEGSNNYNEKTTYKGALLPISNSLGRDEMVNVLKLIGQQKGEIDDARFVELLETKVFDCKNRFTYLHTKDGSEPDRWMLTLLDGAPSHYDLSMFKDGTFAIRHYPGCADLDENNYMYELGYEGWHEMGVWHYDAENDMLYTSEDMLYAAKVLYFDGECAVVEGYVYPMWMYKENGYDEYRRTCPMELYHFTFADGKDSWLDGFDITYEEYEELIKQMAESLE